MRLFVSALAALLLTLSASLAVGQGEAGLADQTERLVQMVQVLTAAEMAGRGAGTPEAEAAADSLIAWLTRLGLQPAFASGWDQSFPLHGRGWNGEDLTGTTGRNVTGILRGSGALADRFVVIGAHHDHLGRLAGIAPEAIPTAGEYYPGANDNASGLAALLEVAALAAGDRDPVPRRSLLVVCFAAEEVGLQGSAHFVADPPVPLDRIDAMVNFDTVGQLTDNRLYVSGVGTAAELPELVAAANTGGLDLSLAQGGWSGSDHMSFNTREIPVLFLFGGPYTQYNTSGDTWETLNFAGLQEIAAYAHRLTEGLRRTESDLAWVMVAEKNLREDEPGDQDRSSWLGTLPDFTEDVSGYKLAGVFDGSPAQRAGLLKGDVLVLMGGREIVDLATFTRALRANSPGDLVEITVLREEKPLNFTVVLGDRKDRK